MSGVAAFKNFRTEAKGLSKNIAKKLAARTQVESNNLGGTLLVAFRTMEKIATHPLIGLEEITSPSLETEKYAY